MMNVVENCVDKTVDKLKDIVKVDDGRFQAKEYVVLFGPGY